MSNIHYDSTNIHTIRAYLRYDMAIYSKRSISDETAREIVTRILYGTFARVPSNNIKVASPKTEYLTILITI